MEFESALCLGHAARCNKQVFDPADLKRFKDFSVQATVFGSWCCPKLGFTSEWTEKMTGFQTDSSLDARPQHHSSV